MQAITWRDVLRAWLPPVLILAVCSLSLKISYLVFHVLAEGFSIVIALSALMVATTSWRFTRNHFLIYIAIGIGWCAVLDGAHTLTFKGMGLLPGDSANPATQLWIAARYLQAAVLISSPLFLRRGVRAEYAHVGFGLAAAAVLVSIAIGAFPAAYIDGQGLTAFKVYSEYLIIMMLGATLVLLWRKKALMPHQVFFALCVALVAMILGEFAFTRYVSVYATANMVGHLLKIIAYWFIYVALVQRTLLEPFEMLKGAQESLRQSVARLERAVLGTAVAVSRMMDMRDPYTSGHERRVGEVSAAIAAEMGLNADIQHGLRVAGSIHDVGKITLPAEMLSKPGKRSAIEYNLIQGHAQQGYEVLKDIDFPWPVAEVARQHHERIDGSGYPRGLKGESILLEARILAVADVVEAMSSHRPYRPGLGIDKALEEIERGRGTAYNTTVADACLKLFRDRGYTIPA